TVQEGDVREEGRDRLLGVLQHAGRGGVDPSVILSSPYRRALETADIAADVLRYKGKIVRTGALVPDGSPPAVWEEIRGRAGETAVLLSSHEPLVSALLAHLLGTPSLAVDMKKGALVRIDFAKLRPEPGGVLKWMLTPALVVEK